MSKNTKLVLRLVVLMLIPVALAGCFGPKVAQVDGKISYEDGEPIVDAQVVLNGQRVSTNAAGAFTLRNVSHGTHMLTVNVGGEQVYSQKLTVGPKMIPLDIKITRVIPTAAVVGVISNEEGAQQTGVQVQLGDLSAATDDTGAFAFDDVPFGTYLLTVKIDGESVHAVEVDVNDETVTLDIVIPEDVRLATVTGTVTGEDGAPLEAQVALAGATQTTASDGSFTFADVHYGAYTLRVMMNNKEVHRKKVTVDAGTIHIDAQVHIATVSGTVDDQVGRPIAGAVVSVDDTSVETDAAGAFILTHVRYGTHTLRIVAPGGYVVEEEITVDSNAIVHDARVEVELVPSFDKWTNKDGGWAEVDGALENTEITLTNSNAWAEVVQRGTVLEYTWSVEYKDTRASTAPSTGLHILSDNPTEKDRGNSYLIWQDKHRMVVYKASGGLSTLKQFPLPDITIGRTYDYKVIVNTDTGSIELYRDGEYVGEAVDNNPLQAGDYLSVRTSETLASFNSIAVKVH